MENPKSEKVALSSSELKKWCEQNKLPFNLCYLDKINECSSRFAFIYTGNENNEANGDNPHRK